MYVIGTAGHVDHGKSSLVERLTGINPDRWAEEQRREMTIDLGFAWLTLPDGRAISLIDVPGHERFIKNMLAGIGGIDAALLIVAADESIMPQTVEHLAILDLLDVRHGLIVLTKCDLVDVDWQALVEEDVRQRVQGSTFADRPCVAVSARSGAGIPQLLTALQQELDRTPTRTSAQGVPRMAIDRAFTIGGFGAVVTGTLLDGPLRIGDEIEVLPRGLRARVRGLQTHNERRESALPGTRVAVNLAGVSHNDLQRGDTLTAPGALLPTDRIDVQLRVVANAGRPLAQNARVDLFVGASETPGRVTLLDRDELAPGESGWAQLRLERPVAVLRGDRYILRRPSPSVTIAGGRVLDPHPSRHRRFRPETIAALEALARGTPADLIQRILSDGQLHTRSEIRRLTGLTDELTAHGLNALYSNGHMTMLEQPEWIVGANGWQRLVDTTQSTLAGYHRRYPLRSGMPREELRSRLKLAADAFDALLATITARRIVSYAEAGVRLPEHQARPDTAQSQAIQRFNAALRAAPYSPPALDLDPELVAWMIEQGRIVRVAPEIAFSADTYAELVTWVHDQLQTAGSVSVAQVRDRFETSRKYALALLEHLDERKLTRRNGDIRVRY